VIDKEEVVCIPTTFVQPSLLRGPENPEKATAYKRRGFHQVAVKMYA